MLEPTRAPNSTDPSARIGKVRRRLGDCRSARHVEHKENQCREHIVTRSFHGQTEIRRQWL
ncbi:hypothetical protein WN51_08695 [Melipona quadrifasciata]|uniref:Uncharacterized protein n=1 Tax=Melipona quadrifasciata TaxID=166423 RepID=A0A0M9A909_9HYME|nr:hypothetical protein WN51_08695 [Melipona quadrifasciata]